MRVFVTGATGFVGQALVQRLLGDGHEVVALVRNPTSARNRLGPAVVTCSASDGIDAWAAALAGCDAVVNLAGENVLATRWTPERRAALWRSRVELTERLVGAMARAAPAPRVFASASAVGYYGDRGDQALREDVAPGDDFLARLCRAWEAAANLARTNGDVRVATLRFGVVLGNGGGALAPMARLFGLGLGGPVGGGRQYVSWIHLDDVVEVILQALSDSRMEGAFNATAPAPVRQREFARQLGVALGRPAVLPAPGLALRALLGARAQVVTASQRVLPGRLEQLGFRFQHPELANALHASFGARAAVSIRKLSRAERAAAPRGARYVLETSADLAVPVERAFAFFGSAQNLGLITPSFMRFELIGEPRRPIVEGARLDYRIHVGRLPMRWRTLIQRWDPPHGFVDTQVKGPYRAWRHEHVLERGASGTRMVDRVYYAPPLGPLSPWLHALGLGATLRSIFAYRKDAVVRLFGPRIAGAR